MSVKNYYKEVWTDISKRCGKQEFTCQYEALATGYHALKTFEDKKIQEKQARTAKVSKPKFTPGQVQAAANPATSSRVAEEAEKTRKAEEAFKSVQQMEQYDSSQEGGD